MILPYARVEKFAVTLNLRIVDQLHIQPRLIKSIILQLLFLTILFNHPLAMLIRTYHVINDKS